MTTVSEPSTRGTEGAVIDVVFIRSAAQPSTPAASVGTPAGWYTDAASVPASPNSLWSSFGQRTNSTANYLWDTPARVEGASDTKSFSGNFLLWRRVGQKLRRGSPGAQSAQGGNPRFRHPTFAAAEAEAQRLLGLFPESSFVILQEVARVKLKLAEAGVGD
jgi:hypothetical protein